MGYKNTPDNQHIGTSISQKVSRDKSTCVKQSRNMAGHNRMQVKVSPKNVEKYPIICQNRYDALSVDVVVSDPVTEQDSPNSGNKDTKGQVTGKLGHREKHNPHLTTVTNSSNMKPIPQPRAEVTSCSKYDLPLRIKNKSITYKEVLPHCPTLQFWEAQNKYKFGFIPLGSLLMPGIVNPAQSSCDPISLHKEIVDSNQYNFLQKQITLKSQLNPDMWDHYLQNYWDKQLPLLIRFGFPLDYDRRGLLRSQETNHPSAIDCPGDVNAYLREEIHHEAIIGPFDNIPIKDLHISPMMTREKPNAPHRRVIIDLSFPLGNSVNTGIPKHQYLGTPFVLKLPTVDTITEQVKTLGRGCKLYKVDISPVFRHVKLDPFEYDLLGLRHDRYYVDTCLPFKRRSASYYASTFF